MGDYGCGPCHAHDLSKRYVESLYPWLETVIVESVSEPDSRRIIDRLVQQQKCDVIFTTSFGYMDDTLKAATKYLVTKFMHCLELKHSAQYGHLFWRPVPDVLPERPYADALNKSNKLGCVVAFPIPELVRHIDAFALGAKAANPGATCT